MPLIQLSSDEGVSRRLLSASFGMIVLLLIVLEGLSYVESRTSQRHSVRLLTQALRSVETIGQVGMDLERERVLVERHILESTQAGMRQIESELAVNDFDMRTAAALYDDEPTFPGEHAVWMRISILSGVKRALLPDVLRLSHTNHDLEARLRLDEMQPLFDAIHGDVATLIALNRAGASDARMEVTERQATALRDRILVGIGIVVLLALTGIFLTRVLAANERQLRDHGAALEDKNRELDAFAGRVAHDLRGPLSAISIASHLLAERVPEQRKTTAIVERGVVRMTNIVDELLALSRIGVTGETAGRTERVAAAIGEDLEPRVREVGGTLRIDLEPAAVKCSDSLVRQIVWNLGENALKYRRPDVALALEITGRAARGHYELAVADNGIGMTDDDARHMFEPFFRAQRTSSISGTGLGLAIVRRVVDAAGGSIDVTSELGRGTRVAIRMPLA